MAKRQRHPFVGGGGPEEAEELEPEAGLELEPVRGAAVLENPNVPPSPPRQSMAGSVLVEEPALAAAERGETSPSLPPVLQENPNPPAVPPRQSMAGAVLVDEPASAADATPTESPPARPVSAPPAAVRTLPRRPRLRASFHYDHTDQLQLELTLMDERRGLIHRHIVQPTGNGALARIFEALIAVAVQDAAVAGVFGETRKPSSE